MDWASFLKFYFGRTWVLNIRPVQCSSTNLLYLKQCIISIRHPRDSNIIEWVIIIRIWRMWNQIWKTKFRINMKIKFKKNSGSRLNLPPTRGNARCRRHRHRAIRCDRSLGARGQRYGEPRQPTRTVWPGVDNRNIPVADAVSVRRAVDAGFRRRAGVRGDRHPRRRPVGRGKNRCDRGSSTAGDDDDRGILLKPWVRVVDARGIFPWTYRRDTLWRMAKTGIAVQLDFSVYSADIHLSMVRPYSRRNPSHHGGKYFAGR